MEGTPRLGTALGCGLDLQRFSVPDSGLSQPVQLCGPDAWRGVFRLGRGATGRLPIDDLPAATGQPQEPQAGGGPRWSRVFDYACSQSDTGPGDLRVGRRVKPAVRALPYGVGAGASADDALVNALLDHTTGAKPRFPDRAVLLRNAFATSPRRDLRSAHLHLDCFRVGVGPASTGALLRDARCAKWRYLAYGELRRSDSGCRTGSFQIRTPRLRWPTLPAVGARARGPAKQILSCSDSLNQFAKFLARLEEGNLLRWHFDSGAAWDAAWGARLGTDGTSPRTLGSAK